jgi:hypothetical protein
MLPDFADRRNAVVAAIDHCYTRRQWLARSGRLPFATNMNRPRTNWGGREASGIINARVSIAPSALEGIVRVQLLAAAENWEFNGLSRTCRHSHHPRRNHSIVFMAQKKILRMKNFDNVLDSKCRATINSTHFNRCTHELLGQDSIE